MSSERGGRGRNRNLMYWFSCAVLVPAVAIGGGLAGLLFGYALDLPEVEELEKVRPNIISYVYADDGRILGQFALERRVLVGYEEIPPLLRDALLAGEDANFFRHTGIDFVRLFTTMVRDIVFGELKGASTLTMQLSKLRFTSTEVTLERKIKDFLYALEIERNYSKEQIFTFYFNQVYLGHGVYGFAAASEFYFNKHLEELELNEAALLVGILPNPTSFSPILHPERALQRRNYVLRRMHEENFIDRDQLQASLEIPVRVDPTPQDHSVAPYFVEWVRQYLQRRYGDDKIWQGGLRVHTTVDYDMQLAANEALRDGLKEFDRQRRRWRGAPENVLENGGDLDGFIAPEWRRFLHPGQTVRGLVLESTPEKALVRFGGFRAEIGAEEIAWTRQTQVDRVLKKGDLAPFELLEVNRQEREIKARLDRIPEVQGALLALDNRTGAIRAMVGGYDFEHSKFNRATQAMRQPGSIFKPFTYVAALEAGYSPTDEVQDFPVTFYDDLGRPYEPKNADGEFMGMMPIRKALALSRNVPTLRLANAVGIQHVIDVAHRFGIRRDFPPYLPVALGAGEATLLEITSAFSVFPNGGVRAEPYFIKRVEDYNGVVLEEHRHQVEEVLSGETAAEMLQLLRAVVLEGTGTRARVLDRPVAGKTGTTNDYTDSWFVGFTPGLTAGVWAGHDQKRTLGNRVFGATLALPIWIDFMKEAIQHLPEEDFDLVPSRAAPLHLVQLEPRRVEGEEKEEEERRERRDDSRGSEIRREVILEEDIQPPR